MTNPLHNATAVVSSGEIMEELSRILQAPSFRTSRRSQQFLSYVVQQELAGATENLRERAIGAAVFDRPPDYDTAEDATVRVAAGEVRKRLAQYYVDSPPGRVRIDIPAGSYIPEFHPGGASPAAPGTARRFKRAWLWAGPAVLVVAAAFLIRNGPWAGNAPFDRFWQPVLDAKQPAVICLTHPVVYLLSERVQYDYVARNKIDQLAGPYVVRPDPKDLKPEDIVPSTDQYVGSGDAFAGSQFTALLKSKNKASNLRIGQDISFADLRSAPAVLIGAYSNRWTMQANAEFRFRFDHFSVVDRSSPEKVWKLSQVSPDYKSNEDYSIVSRVFQSYTGQMLIASAGITNAGTQAAAEFLTNPSYLNSALANAPNGWWKRNMQLVLHCRVINNTPGPPEVVASHFW